MPHCLAAPGKIPLLNKNIHVLKTIRTLGIISTEESLRTKRQLFISFTDPQGEKKQPDFMFAHVYVYLYMFVYIDLQVCVETREQF